ncbi:hemicentin-1-like [Channa argus]|uniref:hemicentin-1-like n=1 Tax=Channa argus TaxID=215402 RepID=UPI00352238D5
MVTVTSATTSRPNVFPLIQCGSGTGDTVSLGCLATGFTPPSLTFKWTRNGAAVTDFIKYPPVQKGNVYTGVSQIQVTRQDWESSQRFKCAVEHVGGNAQTPEIFRPTFSSVTTPSKPYEEREVTPNIMLHPAWENGFWATPVRLICTLSGFFPNKWDVEWKKDNRALSIGETKQKQRTMDGVEETFSLSSEIKPNMGEWEKGSDFTCSSKPNTALTKTINICSVHSASPPSIHVETPSFKTVMMATSAVTATCSVQTVFNAKVTWLMDGRAAQSNTVTQDRNMTIIISTLRVSSSQWKGLNRVTCRAEHKCFSITEKTVNVAGPAVTAPSVEIRRSLPDLLKGNSVVLVCDVTQLSSSDLYITFQANNADISEKLYVDLPESPGPHSVSRTFSVPSNHWKKGTNFTCTVNQGFSRNFKSTGNIFVDSSVELLVVPSEESGPQKLSCSGSGFNPQIQWFFETQQRSSSTNDISVAADGRVTVTSQLHVPQAEWKTEKVFTCEVSDRPLSPNVRKDISFCSVHSASPPSIHVETPSFKTVMMATSVVTATCSVQSDFDAKVTWLMDGRAAQSNTVTQDRNMTIIISTLRVSSSQWKGLNRVTCRAEHKCFSVSEKTVDVAGPAVTAPSVEIRRSLPDLLKGNSVVLVCDVTQLSSSDLYITFQANNSDISEKLYVDLPESPGPHSVSRTFSVPSNHWEKGTSFTCTVNQGFSTNFKSQSTGNIFVDPSVELLVVPSEESGPQKLSCSGSGINAQIQWFSETQQRSSSTKDISVGSDGRVTVTSQLHVPQAEWKTGKVFTCEVSERSSSPKVRKDISFCSVHSASPPSIHVETPSFKTVMMATSVVTATCSVQSDFDAKVTWLMDGRAAQSNTVTQDRNMTIIISTLRVSSSQWKGLNRVTCRAEHKCFSVSEKTVDVAGPAVTAPSVEIRRSLPDLLKGNSVVLVCDVTQLSSSDLYITFQANNSDISEKLYVDLPESPGPHSVSRTFSVPSNHWEKGTSFTCTVNQGFSTNFKSQSTGNIFVDPSVDLLVVPSEESGPQKLSCSGSGFNPQIQWFFETQQRSSSTNDISVAADGRVTVTSQLHVPQAEWKTGKVFTCEVSNRPLSPNVRKDISLFSVHSASPPSIHVETPSFKTVMMATSVVTATCSVQTVFNAKVTWLMDGRAAQSNTVTQNRNMTIIISTLRVSSSQWKRLKRVTCRAEHKCFSITEKTVDVAGPAVTAPSVEIRRSLPDLLKGNSVVLVCDVTQLSSSDLYITFQANNADISEKLYVDLPESPGPHSVSRTLSVPSNHWKKGTSFTCTVNQGFSTNFKSRSTDNIFVDPSVDLLVVPSEESGPQKLSCSGSGFNPQIQWFFETQQRSSSTNDISVAADGRVTVTSQLHVPQAEWKTGKVFTCEVSDRPLSPNVRKDISFCSVHSASPPSIHVETPSFKTVMMATSVVTATCSVQSDFDPKVTWLMDGRAAQSNTVTQNRNMTIIISILRVSSSQWKGLNRVTCRAEHKCFSITEKTVDVAGPAVTAPTVEIRRSLPDLLKGNSVVLVCDVTQLSSSDLYITFQANNADISEKLYVDLPESPGPHSVSRTLSVPSNHWKKGTSFTCTVNQGFSTNFKSRSTGNIFVDPSVELLVVPSEESGPQKLSCSGSGFNPQIQWFFETQQRSSSTNDISVAADGRVTVTSQLHVPQAEWKTGKVFTCEVSDRPLSPNVRKDISFCSVHSASPPSIHVETPSFKTVMMATSVVTATCSVQSDFDAKVTWLMDGRAAQSNTVTQDRNMTIIISTLRVSSSQWKGLNNVTCRAEHKCFSTTEKTVDVAGPAVTAPTVEIRRSLPDLLKGNSVVLVCDVTQLSSSDLYITFQANNADISEKLYVDLPESPGPYSVSRTFSVPSNHWKKGTSFTCTVNQGFSRNFKSQSTGNIFVDPSVELLVVPSEESGPQKLSCSGSGINAQIQWFSETQQRSSSTKDISVGSDGRVTVTSQLHVPQAEWKTGKVFTCEVSERSSSPKVRKDISFCSVHSASPPSIHVETPSFKTVMMATSEVTATCSVQSDFDAKVTWLMDGRAAQSNTVTQDRNMTIIISTLRVSSSQWKQLNRVTCRAEHKCFSTTEKTVDVAGPAVTAPTVEIRRSLPDLLKGNSVVLVCDVTQLSSSDLYITFQANNADISEKLYVDLPESPGPHSVSRTFSVPSNHWKKGTSFTCTVNQGFSRNFKSQSTGNIFVDPSVELLVVPSEESGPQKLSCSGSGINAQIQWFSETQQRSSSTKDISVGADGRVTVTSQLHVPQAEWKTGKVFTCEVSERSSSPKVRKDISFCSVHSASPPSIHVETPSFKTVMMATSEVTATCSVQSDFDAKVTWLMDGRAAQSNTVTQDRNMTIIISTLRVSSSQWKQLKRVTCRAEHKCFSTTEKTVDVAGPAVTAPSVEIRRSLPDLLKGNSVVLVCDVTQLSSSDLYITFQANNADISEKLYVDLPESPGPHSVSRTFSVPSNHWKKGTSFTCTVNQGFSRNFKSQSTGNIFVDPSVELLVVPSEESGPQKLSCSGSGFNPQIQWFFETQQRSSSTNDISVAADGRVTVTSQLHVPQAEWKTGKVFTCEVSERSLSQKVRKDISFCPVHSASPPSIHVETPSFKTVMMATSEVTATCSVQSDFDAKVTWLMDGRAAQSNTVTQDRNMTIIISTLRVSSSQWKQLKRVTCRAEHKCFSITEKTVDVAGKKIHNKNISCFVTRNQKENIWICFLLFSSRTCSYSSISGDQEISPRFAEGKQCCARL